MLNYRWFTLYFCQTMQVLTNAHIVHGLALPCKRTPGHIVFRDLVFPDDHRVLPRMPQALKVFLTPWLLLCLFLTTV